MIPSPHSNTESVEDLLSSLHADFGKLHTVDDECVPQAKTRLLNLILSTKPEPLKGDDEVKQGYNYALQDWEAGIRKVFNKVQGG